MSHVYNYFTTIYIIVYIYIYIYIYICICTHTHTHIHTYSGAHRRYRARRRSHAHKSFIVLECVIPPYRVPSNIPPAKTTTSCVFFSRVIPPCRVHPPTHLPPKSHHTSAHFLCVSHALPSILQHMHIAITTLMGVSLH